MSKEKMYFDPEYDRLVPESEIQRQYNWFRDNGYTYKTYEQFKADNFMDKKYYKRVSTIIDNWEL